MCILLLCCNMILKTLKQNQFSFPYEMLSKLFSTILFICIDEKIFGASRLLLPNSYWGNQNNMGAPLRFLFR